VADGLAVLAGTGDPGPQARQTLERLAADADPLVQAAAFKAAGAMGCPPPLDALAVAALPPTASAPPTASTAPWQVRAGAAQALAAAAPDLAVPPLARAARDPHAGVRKAAVIALAAMTSHPAAIDALRAAADDPDADVRAYARRAARPVARVT
jgi:HEAT repeat protein